MSSWGKRLLLLAVCAITTGAAFGQDWPLPARTPNTDVLCNTSSCDASQQGKKLAGYSGAISTFVGRYADNAKQAWQFHPVGTARTKQVWFVPSRNRIYTILGSLVFAYDMDTFFSRLAGGEQIIPVSQVSGLTLASRGAEKVFNDDRVFPLQQAWGDTGGDGERSIRRIDWDDRGLIYAAADSVGWGIVRDDLGKGGGEMPSVYHGSDIGAMSVLSVKTSDGGYYVLVRDEVATTLMNVANPAQPQGSPSNVAFDEFAKSADGTRIAVLRSGAIRIYSNDAIVRNGQPLATFSGKFANVTTDGTNFFTAYVNANYNLVITVISPSGSSYTSLDHTITNVKSDVLPYVAVHTNPDAGGYLTALTSETAYASSSNIRLFKLVNLVPTEVSIDQYFTKYYGKNQPAGYTNPGIFSLLQEAHVLKRGAKYYLIISDYGLGDVYEIKGADTITARVKSFGRTPNLNSKAAPNSGPFYGDEITFTSAYSGSVAPSVTWDFGDGIQQTVTPGTAGAPDIAHQYGGLTAASLPVTRTVTATNAGDPSMNHSINVTLARPQARVGVVGTSILFTSSSTDLTLPIVSSDRFFDGSDGAVEGHSSEWKLVTDTASTRLLPNQTFGVGALGTRELTFTGHYGPSTGAADAAFTVGPIQYKVRAFAPVVTGPVASGDNVVFQSATRVTTNATDLPNGTGTQVNYLWELLDQNNAVVRLPSGQPVSASGGPIAISSIPSFAIARSTFGGATDWKVRLTVELPGCPACSPSIPSTFETAPSGLLNGPSPKSILVNGCLNVGSPCALTTEANDANWTYTWEVTSGPAGVNGAQTASFSPAFTVAGAYTVTVKVTNALGDAPLLTKNLTIGAALCSSDPAGKTGINYVGAKSGCFDQYSNCSTGETISFSFSSLGWTPQACDKYSWNFGDGGTSTLQSPTHSYTSAQTYQITLIIDGGISDATVTKTLKVGSTTGGGGGGGGGTGGGGGGTGGCTVMVAGLNVYATWSGATSGCTSVSGDCSTGETVTFRPAAFSYNYGCGPHTFIFDFGDGSPTVTTTDYLQAVNHTYSAAGTWPLNVQISNPIPQTVTYSSNVKVVAGTGGGGGNGGGGGGGGTGTSCGTMQPGFNVSVSYTGPTSNCTAISGTCATSENIQFTLSTLGYNLECANHTFLWNFADGTTSTQQNPTHAYTTGGDYNVSLTITRADNATVTLQRTVKVAGTNNCPTMVAGQNVVLTYYGFESKCTQDGGTCQEGEQIGFGANARGYNFACSGHTFLWNFGDGTTSTEQAPTHTYATKGDYVVTLTIRNSKQELVMSQHVVIPASPTKRRSTRH